MHNIEEIEWYFNSSTDPKTVKEQVYYTEHLLISPDAHLQLYNIQVRNIKIKASLNNLK